MSDMSMLKLDEKTLMSMSIEDLSWIDWQQRWAATARSQQIAPEDPGWMFWLVIAGRGFGKQLCLRTPVPTPSGWATIGELKIGDRLFDEEGRECRVQALHPIDLMPDSYRVKFSDGTHIDACAEHLWTTWEHRDRKQFLRKNPDAIDFPPEWYKWRMPSFVGSEFGPKVRDTHEIRHTLTYGKRDDLNHCIPVCRPIELPEQQLPVPPWTLGYWLGNGDKKSGAITAGSHDGVFDDDHVVRALADEGFTAKARRIESAGQSYVGTRGLLRCLRAAGVLDDKHIPAAYLRAAVWQRLRLLQGLMDSDGYAGGGTSFVEFCSIDERLARGVLELVRSLGERPTISEDRARLNGNDYGPRWRVTWRPSLFNPFSLPRKAEMIAPVGAQALRLRHRMIVSVDRIDPVPMRCITVDSPSGLFLAGEGMVPTHNTRVGAEWIANEAWIDAGSFNTVIAPTYADVKLTCFEGESGLLAVIPPKLIKTYNKSDLIIELVNGSIIRGFTSEKPARLRGPQHHRVWCDELAAWSYPDATWDMMMFGLRLGEHPRVCVTTTPKPIPLVKRLMKDPKSTVTRGSTYDNKANLAGVFIEQMKQYEGTKLGRQEIHGEIIDPEEAGIVKRSQFRLWPANKPLPIFDAVVISLDTAFTERTLDDNGDPDPTGCIVFGHWWHDGKPAFIFLDVWEDWLSYPDLVTRVKDEMKVAYGEDDTRAVIHPKWGSTKPTYAGRKADLLIIEDKGSGISLRQSLSREGITAHPYNPGRADKITRLHLVSDMFAQGQIWVVESNKTPGQPRSWTEPAIEQLCSFAGEGSIPHDEFVDCTTQALLVCRDKFLGSARKPINPRNRVRAPKTARVNPYGA